MMHRQTVSTLLVGATFFAMAGCKISPPAAPITPLTQAQFNQVSDCQAAIKKESLDFTEIKTKKLHRCVDNVVDLQLQLENGLITQAQFDTAMEKERVKCARAYELVAKASTNLIDGINYFCKPIESLILGPDDPLQFQTLYDEVFSAPSEIEDIGGFICGIKEVLVDVALGLEVPRLCHALATLGPEFVFDSSDPFCLPNILLDPRCEFFSAPPP